MQVTELRFERELELINSLNDNDLLEQDAQDAIEHGRIVSVLLYCLTQSLGYPNDFCEQMAMAGVVHDIGKLRLNRSMYRRDMNRLSIAEMKYVRLHPLLSYTVLKETDDYSDELLDAIYHHHENMDGSGYPDNIRGDEISIGARMIRLCDTFAALVSHRHYRTAFDLQTSVELMIDEIKNFDMRLFLAFMNVVNDEDMMEYLRTKGVKCA